MIKRKGAGHGYTDTCVHIAGLIKCQVPWFGYRESRYITSHVYDPAKARKYFGSRVVLNATYRARLKLHADLDLVLETLPLKPHEADALREAFSESDLPMRVDTVAADDLPGEWDIRAWPL